MVPAGQRAAEMLIGLIGPHDREPIHELWEAELVVGQTTGPTPGDGPAMGTADAHPKERERD